MGKLTPEVRELAESVFREDGYLLEIVKRKWEK